jgi:hypothetical protein
VRVSDVGVEWDDEGITDLIAGARRDVKLEREPSGFLLEYNEPQSASQQSQ